MSANATPRTFTLTLNSTHELVELIDSRVALALEGKTEDPWMNAEDAATYMRCTRSRIYDLIQLGRLTPTKEGQRVLFRRSQLEAYLESGNRRNGGRNGRSRLSR